jgi:hypothetical protein
MNCEAHSRRRRKLLLPKLEAAELRGRRFLFASPTVEEKSVQAGNHMPLRSIYMPAVVS